MGRTMRRLTAALLLATAPATLQAGEREAKKQPEKSWLPDEMPLPLVVKNPQDLQFKQVAEREYLVFSLLAGGKLAYDQGRFSEAADSWETLLTVPGLDREIDRVVRPLAIDARTKAGQTSTVAPVPPPPPPAPDPQQNKPKAAAKTAVDVSGQVSGGGAQGAGGAVVSLRRADGKTPAPSAAGAWIVDQRGKQFVPRIIAVPVGATVSFRNQDPIFHDVFSLSKPNDFDLGLYKNGVERTQTFTKPGAVQLFCNIHAQMSAWVVVEDTPYFAVADAAGRFVIRNVPPGDYTVEVWHEAASSPTKGTAQVAATMAPLSFVVAGDRRSPAFPPDKYGKARQVQLGY